MAKITRADLFVQDAGEGVPLLEALGPLASGVNKDGTIFTIEPPDVTTAAALVAVNGAATTVVTQGMSSAGVQVLGTFVGTVAFEYSPDNAVTWLAFPMARIDTVAGAVATTATSVSGWEAALPAGITHIRARCTAFTSGTINVRTSISYSAYEPVVSVTTIPPLIASGSVVGAITKATVSYDETAALTQLAFGATGFSTARDLQAVALGATAAGTARYPDRFRAHVSADAPFTLGVEYDIAATFTTPNEAGNVNASPGRGGRYFASLDVAVLNRFGRIYVTNTSTTTAFTTMRAYVTQVG